MATDARAPDDAGSGDAPPATLDAALTADARPVDAGPGCAIDGGAAPVRFGAIYDGIITANGCASGGCHDGGDPGTGATSRGGFDMTSEAAAYASLVNVTGCRGVRVVPCSPEASYFSEVIRVGDGICAGRRHAQGMLSPDEIAMVDEWIRTGAR